MLGLNELEMTLPKWDYDLGRVMFGKIAPPSLVLGLRRTFKRQEFSWSWNVLFVFGLVASTGCAFKKFPVDFDARFRKSLLKERSSDC